MAGSEKDFKDNVIRKAMIQDLAVISGSIASVLIPIGAVVYIFSLIAFFIWGVKLGMIVAGGIFTVGTVLGGFWLAVNMNN